MESGGDTRTHAQGGLEPPSMEGTRVFLVGAGPGHPGLLTLRGAECLRRADLVLYDKLVAPALLEHAPATAERICISALTQCHPQHYQRIHEAMIEAARKGKCVVRL